MQSRIPITDQRIGVVSSSTSSRDELAVAGDHHRLALAGADRIDRNLRIAVGRAPSAISGCTTSSFCPCSVACLTVEVAVPTTSAELHGRISASVRLPRFADALNAVPAHAAACPECTNRRSASSAARG